MAITQATDLLEDYGPGTYIDTSFTPVPEECTRLLKVFAAKTPGFTQNPALLDGVIYEGDDLPYIPGPIKAQAVTAVLHAMVGIVGLEMLHLRGDDTSTTTYVNTNHAGLYPTTPALVTVDGQTGPSVIALPSVPQWDKDRQSGSPLVYRATAIYPTADDGIWFQLHGSLDPWTMLKTIGIEEPFTQEEKHLTACEFNYEETIFATLTIGAVSWFLGHLPDEQDRTATTLITKSGPIAMSQVASSPGVVAADIAHNVHIHAARFPLSELLRLESERSRR